MKVLALSVILALCLAMNLPDNALAGTKVTVYLAGGFVVGGFALFYTIVVGSSSRSSKKKISPKYSEEKSLDMYAYNYRTDYYVEDDLNQAMMVKVFEW